MIPEFVQTLLKYAGDDSEEALKFLTSNRLISMLHEFGINIRFLGLVRKVIFLTFCFIIHFQIFGSLIFFCNHKQSRIDSLFLSLFFVSLFGLFCDMKRCDYTFIIVVFRYLLIFVCVEYTYIQTHVYVSMYVCSLSLCVCVCSV